MRGFDPWPNNHEDPSLGLLILNFRWNLAAALSGNFGWLLRVAPTDLCLRQIDLLLGPSPAPPPKEKAASLR